MRALLLALNILAVTQLYAQSKFEVITFAIERNNNNLKKTDGHITIKNSIMSIKYANNKVVKFVSNPKACDKDDSDKCVRHVVIGFVPVKSYYIVGEYFYEWQSYYLVNPRHNQMIKMNAKPEFSPNGEHVLANSCNHPYNGEEFKLYSLVSDKFSNVFKYNNDMREGHKYCYGFKNWIGNDKIELEIFDYSDVKSARFTSLNKETINWLLK